MVFQNVVPMSTTSTATSGTSRCPDRRQTSATASSTHTSAKPICTATWYPAQKPAVIRESARLARSSPASMPEGRSRSSTSRAYCAGTASAKSTTSVPQPSSAADRAVRNRRSAGDAGTAWATTQATT